MPADLGKALRLLPSTGGGRPHDRVVLSYDERLLRRKRLKTAGGDSFLADLPETVSLKGGEALELEDGRLIEVEAGEDDLLEITGRDLVRFAWHIGNRHAPCQIEDDRLLIQRDPVMAEMLRQLGAGVAEVSAPFAPEGGAYGHGRTLGHEHGHVHGHVHHHADHKHIEDEGEEEPRGPSVIDEA
ncbi:urease accessory protein UreE [Actibacterium sp. MT2.3-13A]|uniref:urease accessory protein UreE n=1 Tax=Actibacterium sp. MT2.3-13A TaxID=2828332 RepID=UPI001BAAA7E8|nr:urease accessory protein UreE [Actibacterium sp. MT2.3-13A]